MQELLIVKQSGIHDKGVFVGMNLSKGDEIEICAKTISYEKYNSIRFKLGIGRRKEYFLTSAKFVIDLRESELRYLNHSENPNLDWDNDKRFVAQRDIIKGEELTINYGWVNYRWN